MLFFSAGTKLSGLILVHVRTSKLRLMAIGHGIHPNRHQPSDYYPVALSWASDELKQKKNAEKRPSCVEAGMPVRHSHCQSCRFSAGLRHPGSVLHGARVEYCITHLIVAAVKEKIFPFLPHVLKRQWQMIDGEWALDIGRRCARALKRGR